MRFQEAGQLPNVIDLAPQFLDAGGERYDVCRDGHVLYHDSHHITVYAALNLIFPVLEKSLGEAIQQERDRGDVDGAPPEEREPELGAEDLQDRQTTLPGRQL